jgi:tetratricopeptide (TPR) repeat protein
VHLDLLKTEWALRDAAAALPSAQANGARRQEAQFYIANRLDAEALGVVAQMQSSDPTLQSDPELQTIKAAADVMLARYRDARSALSATAFANDPHAAIWRGLADAGLRRWPQARHALMLAMTVIGRYPPRWQALVRIAYAHAAIAGQGLGVAQKMLAGLPKHLRPPLSYEAELERARLDVAEGRYRAAAPLFAALKQCPDAQVAAHAIYDDTISALAAGAISRGQAIASLERLRYRWRGDALELQTLRKLGALYFAQKKWRKGLGVLQVAVESFPNDESTRHVQDDMRKAFIALFLHGKADNMPPIQALGLFYDYIDLTPIGADGDAMIRRMANRLVEIDLLGPAEKLLKYQVDKRLNGVAQAQVAGRLAMVYLMDHKARHALAVLRATRVAGMPDDVAHARLLLEARALAALKQYAQALDLIAVETGADTQRLRADIYWESGNWPMAGQAAEKLLGNAWSAKGGLSKVQRRYVMRAAIAYSLAGDAASLSRLRSHFARQMAQSPEAASFAVVTQNVSTQGVAFRDIAAKVASIDTLESFMKDFKKRFDAMPPAH